MGWASGDEVFDPVARLVIDYVEDNYIPDYAGKRILSVLISGLQQYGWDTEGESLGLFQNIPWVVEAFAERGVKQEDD